MTKLTPLQLIAKERETAIEKGHTPESDYKTYKQFELKEIALALIHWKVKFPVTFPGDYAKVLLAKPYKERLAIAAQFLIAEMEWVDLDEIAKAPSPEEIDQQIAELQRRKHMLTNGSNS